MLERVLQLETEVEARKAEGKTLLEDNMRWKGRAQQILEKYERIDPVEHENLKKNVESLTAQKQEFEARLANVKSEFDQQINEKSIQVFIGYLTHRLQNWNSNYNPSKIHIQ
jgi:nucleoprotein TPR